jgi:hypothetical protein
MKPRMTSSLTIRLPGPAARHLRARARALGISPSQLARTVLEKEIGVPEGEPSAFKLTERWIGVVRGDGISRARDARRTLESWKPDRRG